MTHVQTAEVYFRRARIYVTAFHRMEPGFWRHGEPTFDLAADCAVSELGSAVASALAASQTNHPYDRATRNQWPAVQRMAKARSWGLFIKGTRRVKVERRPTGVVVQAPNETSMEASDAEELLSLDATPDAIALVVKRVAENAVPHSGKKPS